MVAIALQKKLDVREITIAHLLRLACNRRSERSEKPVGSGLRIIQVLDFCQTVLANYRSIVARIRHDFR
jgi:hypothetical protein